MVGKKRWQMGFIIVSATKMCMEWIGGDEGVQIFAFRPSRLQVASLQTTLLRLYNCLSVDPSVHKNPDIDESRLVTSPKSVNCQ